MRLGYFISWMHPVLVHFPIVLLLSAFFTEVVGWIRGNKNLALTARGLLIFGCVSSLFAFISGNFAEVFAVRGGTPHDPVDAHGIWAMVTTWCFILLTVSRFYIQPLKHVFLFKVYLLGLLVASGFLGYTAHQGGCLVFDHGASVGALHETHGLDMKDLRDLYQEQNEESITYSEMMHHIFGWLVLAMSLFLIVSKIWPERTKQLWRGGPFVLLAGGFFLMIFSDTDAWPLSNARPIYDKEVLQHKIFATLMLSAGILSLWRRRRQENHVPSSNYHLGLALLALVGGGLLFTHVHSVAPYSNRAVGVYLHHFTLGVVALLAGTVSLWEAVQMQGPRWRTFLWPSILLVESFLLICYNENIPWFVRGLPDPVSQVESQSYDLDVQFNPEKPSAGKDCQMHFTVRKAGSQEAVRELEVVHENPLHLMIVSKDLAFFDHVHPLLQKDGTLILNYHFPHGGEFLLFSDAVPKGSGTHHFRRVISVDGSSVSSKALFETAYETVKMGTHQILLFTKPVILAPGQPSRLRFAVYENEKGVGDLEPFLGCFGHCVVISEDTSYYLHTHPDDHQHGAVASKNTDVFAEVVQNAKDGFPSLGEERRMMFAMGMTSPSMRYGGPEVSFPVIFPKSGLYKVWGQFRHHNEILTVPFVVRVP